MNLQVTSPYKPCPFQCPYCVSRFEGEYPWHNLYEENRVEYLARLGDVLATGEFRGVVLTGMTEPTLFPQWIEDVVQVANLFDLKEITLQTYNDKYRKTDGLTVVAYSIGSFHQIHNTYAPEGKVTLRFNMMLSKKFDFDDALEFMAAHPKAQYTIKYLMPTSNGEAETDMWIKHNRLELEPEQKDYLRRRSVWIDESCMDNAERYRIFREDGNLYQNWFEKI